MGTTITISTAPTPLTSLGAGNVTQPNQDFSRLSPNGTVSTTTSASCNPGFSGFNCSIYNCSINDAVSCTNSSIDCSSPIIYNSCPQTCNFFCQQTTKRTRVPSIAPVTNPTTTDSILLVTNLTSTVCNHINCSINQIFNQSTCSCNYNCSIADPYDPCLSSFVDCRNATIASICLGTCANCTKLLNLTTLSISSSNILSTTKIINQTSSFISLSSSISSKSNISNTTIILNSLTSTNLLSSSTIVATTTTQVTTSCNFIICSITEVFNFATCLCDCASGFSGINCTNYNCSIPDLPGCNNPDCTVSSNKIICPNKCLC